MTHNDGKTPDLTSGKNISYWTDSVIPLSKNPLKENLKTTQASAGTRWTRQK